MFLLPVADHRTVIVNFRAQPAFFGQSVAELVRAGVSSLRQLRVSKEKVGRAQSPIGHGKVWIQFDSSLKKFEPTLSVAGKGEFEPLSGGLQSLERRAERLFQWLIEARQRIRGLSQLRAKACGGDSKFVYVLVPPTDRRLLLGQGCSRPAVERPHLQMVAIVGIADRLGDDQL